MLTREHPFFPKFEELMAEAARNTPVYDLGTSKRFAKEAGLVRHLFDEATYFAGGYDPSSEHGADNCDFHCDIQDMPQIATASAGSVICLEVLEHVEDPERAAAELARILRPGGVLILAVPFMGAYHGKRPPAHNPVYERNAEGLRSDASHSGYGDYWRFTHEGLALRLSRAGFSRVDVFPIDGALLTRLWLLGLGPRLARTPFLMRLLGRFDRPRLGRSTTLHFVRGIR
jgi:SAM-dependent methyltransferase